MSKSNTKKTKTIVPPYRPDPPPFAEPVDGEALLNEIADTYRRYVVLPEHAAETLALFTLHTYALDATNITPIMAILSAEKRCGKTTTLLVTQALVRRPVLTANITAPALYRFVEQHTPTLIFDEADCYMFAPGRDDLRGILNAGNRRGSVAIRTTGEDYSAVAFRTFCPKVIAAIGELHHVTADRSIQIPLKRRMPGETVARLREDRLSEAVAELRMRAVRWSADHIDALTKADPEMPESLDDRAQDNWRPLIAIADEIGGQWPKEARDAAVALSKQRGEQISDETQLLLDLRDMFNGEWTRLRTSEIINELVRMEDRRWSEYTNGRSITPAQVARLVRGYGVKPKKIRFGSLLAQGYERADFADAFARYSARQDEPEQAEQPEHETGSGVDCGG